MITTYKESNTETVFSTKLIKHGHPKNTTLIFNGKYNPSLSLLNVTQGVTLAQLVKASVGQSDVRRFEPHLGHNLLSCGVFLVKSRHFGLTLAQTIMAKLAISLSGWLGRYTNVEYLQSLYLKK